MWIIDFDNHQIAVKPASSDIKSAWKKDFGELSNFHCQGEEEQFLRMRQSLSEMRIVECNNSSSLLSVMACKPNPVARARRKVTRCTATITRRSLSVCVVCESKPPSHAIIATFFLSRFSGARFLQRHIVMDKWRKHTHTHTHAHKHARTHTKRALIAH